MSVYVCVHVCTCVLVWVYVVRYQDRVSSIASCLIFWDRVSSLAQHFPACWNDWPDSGYPPVSILLHSETLKSQMYTKGQHLTRVSNSGPQTCMTVTLLPNSWQSPIVLQAACFHHSGKKTLWEWDQVFQSSHLKFSVSDSSSEFLHT